jgi:hypothetical protein
MTDPSYTPTFTFEPWIDNVSRVRAAGTDGFNGKFEAIENDLHQASTVVATIAGLIDSTVSGPPSGQQRLLVPLDTVNTGSGSPQPGVWFYDLGGAIHPVPGPASPNADASMDLSLPDHATLTSMRVIGLFRSGGASMTVEVRRYSLIDTAQPPDVVATTTVDGSANTNPYDVSAPVKAAFAAVNNDQYRYALTFSAIMTVLNGTDLLSVDSVELLYTLP